MTHSEKTVDLIRVATQQRLLLWLILLIILSNIISLMGLQAMPELMIVGGLCALLFQLLSLIQVYRLTIALRASIAWPIVMTLFFWIPLLPLIILLILNNKATTMLKGTGVKIGLMGVPKSEYPKLMPGHCSKCGYNLQGLGSENQCPECGHMVATASFDSGHQPQVEYT